MAAIDFEIVEVDSWPDDIPPPKKAILKFLASDLDVAEIKGPKEFLVNVRRASKSNKELTDKVELKMVNNRMFIRRKGTDSVAS